MVDINRFSVPGIFTTLFVAQPVPFVPSVPAEYVFWVKRPSLRDPELEALIDSKWQAQIETKKRELEARGVQDIAIRPDERGLPALYEGERKIMFDGTIFRVSDVCPAFDGTEAVCIDVEEGRFSTINLSRDPEFRALSEKKSGEIRNDALGSSELLVTKDGYIVLTNRGERPNTYKNQMYMPGGRPSTVAESPLEHQLGENAEELGLTSEDYLRGTKHCFYGIVADEQLNRNRELMFKVELSLTADEVQKRYDALPKKPIDVASLEFLSADADSILGRLLNDALCPRNKPGIVIPPTLGLLTHYGFHSYGQMWLEELDIKVKEGDF